MIILYTFGSKFNQPDPSPFVMKAEVLLKMSQLPYETKSTLDTRKAPKGKFPYIVDREQTIGDSSFIRFYLEDTYQIDFDRDCNRIDLASAFLAEKYCEDHLYFLSLANRWLVQDNFNKGPKALFQDIPWIMRSQITKKVVKNFEQTLWLQGLGRHSIAERCRLVDRGSKMLATVLEDKDFFGGKQPCGSDASIFASLVGILNDFFECPYRQYFIRHDNLVAYVERMVEKYYPAYQNRYTTSDLKSDL